MLFGLLCVSVTPRCGRQLLLLITAVVSLWIGAQAIYYRLFKTFLSLFSVTKMAMVAGAFGGMAVNEILLNWLPILLLSIPFFLSLPLGRQLIPDTVDFYGFRIRWLMLTGNDSRGCFAAFSSKGCGSLARIPERSCPAGYPGGKEALISARPRG